MPHFIANHKGFFLCIFSMLLAFMASFFMKIDLSQIITTITITYMTGQSVQRGSSYFAAANDPNSKVLDAIHSTIGLKATLQSVVPSSFSWIFDNLPSRHPGAVKAYEEDENHG